MKFSGPPYFHIGLHKTGTTFLQKDVFPLFEEFFLIRKEFRHLIDYPGYMLKCPKGKGLLVSWERLSGMPWEGDWLDEFKTYAQRITYLFPDACCIIGFRRHDQLVRSFYKQYLQVGGTREPEFVFSPDDSGQITHDELFFKRRLDILRDEFEDVFIYTQEGLKNEFCAFLSGISKFLGTESPSVDDVDQTGRNIGVKTDFQVRLLRRLNQLDHRLERLPLVPTLHNRIFQYFNLTPRDFCQKKLRGKGGGRRIYAPGGN